jgi:V/A-type H+-transporting ATPase subunit I
MAMLQMQRIFIYALKKDRKPILEFLQRRGVVEISDTIPEDNVFHKTDMSYARSGFEKIITEAKEAVEILNHLVPENKSMLSILNGRKVVSTEDYDTFRTKYESTERIASHIISSNKEIIETKAEILKLEAQVEILTPWTDLDIPFNFSETKYTKSFIGTLPREWTLEAIYEKLADYLPINVDIISSSKEQTCIFVLCTKDKAEGLYDALRAIEFSHPSITSDRAPAEQLEYLNKRLSEARLEIEKAEKDIISLETSREDLLFLQDYDRMRSDKYEVIGQLLQSNNVFVMTGYIPQRDAKSLEDALNNEFVIAIELEEPSEEEDVPVLLNNNGFSAPLEGVVAGFSYPGKGETDPTMVMSLFYYLLFGLMLSDAGYGALMVAGCAFGLIKFRKTMESSMINTLKMYLFCGISTIFWGIMFGSYFGDIVDVVSETFFGQKITIPPLWFFPVNEPMRLLSFAMLLGLIHLLAGLSMKFYQLLMQKDFKSILYDVVTWFVLLVSSTILLLSMQMMRDILGINFTVPTVAVNVSAVLAVISAIGIVLTNGRESRNPFKRFLKGAYALYGITGYLSDVLSYSRLLALGLATGVIGSVINKMAAMTAGGLLGPLFFALVVVGGHTLNIAINALGAYVHTNRLQYVEFFGKFYEGGGRKFDPFGIKTKYYNVKEKN